MPPAARITDMHTCPLVTPGTPPVPHVGGPIITGEPTVIVAGMPQPRVTDKCACVGPPDVIVKGSPTVFVGGMPAARIGDMTSHGGGINTGAPNVLIGEAGAGGAASISEDAAHLSVLQTRAGSVNPNNGTINCGKIIDAVVDRINGADPDATADTGQNGLWSDIEARHDTEFDWSGQSFESVYQQVEDGGSGTTGLIGIGYSNGTTSHVVAITNLNGTVTIVEGQGGGSAIDNAADANAAYNSDGGSQIGFAMLD